VVSATLSLSLSQCGERFGEERIFFGSLLFEKKVNKIKLNQARRIFLFLIGFFFGYFR
jgi:hypothetical protein